jgi:hypothetical protein
VGCGQRGRGRQRHPTDRFGGRPGSRWRTSSARSSRRCWHP